MISPFYDTQFVIGEELWGANLAGDPGNVTSFWLGHSCNLPETIAGKVFYKSREYDLKVDAGGSGGVVRIHGSAGGDEIYPVGGRFIAGTSVLKIYWNKKFDFDKKDVRVVVNYEYSPECTPESMRDKAKKPDGVRSIFDNWEVSQT